MATIVLSAAGAALGGSVGGTLAGISSVAVGRFAGAALGRVIDQRLLGQGAEPVETGKVDRFRFTQSGEGAPLARVHGRMRVAGQTIWASQFREKVSRSGGGGGKGGAPAQPETVAYSYSISLAIALCEGEVSSIGRIWADGEEIAPSGLNMRVYNGSRDQLPDPLIEATEGAGSVPAYRGTAYVVIEDLQLGRFGNRVPQFSFEVVRKEQPGLPGYDESLSRQVSAVAVIPGTGEYALATQQVNYSKGWGRNWAANVHSPSGKPDFVTSMDALADELPHCKAASLVVSWFGGDLRCGECRVQPKIERRQYEGTNMPWRVSGASRSNAEQIPQKDGEPIYGGTPADASVVQAIRHINAQGKRVMFYPFILMDQFDGNELPDPWTGEQGQPALPWRGRITLSRAAGREGSPDGTVDAETEVASFFGTVKASDFTVGNGSVQYAGPQEWSFSRFILHYAALCASAGGVSAFCIGSELRGLTQIRGSAGFPVVEQLRVLAAEVRQLLGPETKLGYAADWSEYFGYQPTHKPGDRYFHLDPLWADANIDFIGIDNYMPMSDWRDGEGHLDALAGARSIYDPEYLKANIEGGEGYDWYYPSTEARAAQLRHPITDQEHDEPWIWRYKDIRAWWSNPHFERIDGVRQVQPTAWQPGSKPIWFTELGCAAIDKGTNQPNKFLDPKSSESDLPVFSNGQRDDFIQHQYLRAVLEYWNDPVRNPRSEEYDGPMIDMSNAYVWAWDARPFPSFPNRSDIWDDGKNYARGHWLNGRAGQVPLSAVVAEICVSAGLAGIDVAQLWGMVRGYASDRVEDARSALQPLMLRHGFDTIERDGILEFRLRSGRDVHEISADVLASTAEIDGDMETRREAESQMSGRVRLRFVQAEGDFDVVSEEAVLPDDETHAVATSEVPLALTRGEGLQTVERWLSEARASRDYARFALPPSKLGLGAGDVVRLPDAPDGDGALYRIDRIEQTELQLAEATRIEPELYLTRSVLDDVPLYRPFVPAVPVTPVFMDLPLLTGDEVPHAPHLAVASDPWPGPVAVYSALSDADYRLDQVVAAAATMGQTETPLFKAGAGVWDQGQGLQVRLLSGELESKPTQDVLNGANVAAIGDGSSGNWEIIQFQQAELIGPDTYMLRSRLRGQAGTDAFIPEVWPTGSIFVLLDPAVGQIPLSSSERRVAKHFRIGPAARGYDDSSYQHLLEAFDGNGLRPYRPAHLSVQQAGQGLRAVWIRRTRVDGDSWDVPEVPLGEENEAYHLRVIKEGVVLRELTVVEPSWFYPEAEQYQDGIDDATYLQVSQLSARYGPGPYATVALSG